MKHIVTIGGGTGSFTVLGALKSSPVHLTAIVSMADDGGSTGVLRDHYGVLPPGDVRRALVALSRSTDTMRSLFNYRFGEGSLKGHSFGNLFIAALEKVTGSFSSALEEASNILSIDGEVAPVTLDDIRLCARLKDGTIIRGETNIDIPRSPHRAPIEKIWLEPEARMNPSVKRILKNADLIVIGPGDLYTSILPNLLVRGVAEEIRNSKAKKVFMCSLMTKRGETDGYVAEDFLHVMDEYLGKGTLDFAIFNNKKPPERLLKKYRKEGSEFINPPKPGPKGKQPKLIFGDLIDTEKFIRHGPPRAIAKILLSLTGA
jgi:uncharacterized cofD-like protein